MRTWNQILTACNRFAYEILGVLSLCAQSYVCVRVCVWVCVCMYLHVAMLIFVVPAPDAKQVVQITRNKLLSRLTRLTQMCVSVVAMWLLPLTRIPDNVAPSSTLENPFPRHCFQHNYMHAMLALACVCVCACAWEWVRVCEPYFRLMTASTRIRQMKKSTSTCGWGEVEPATSFGHVYRENHNP